MTHRQIAPIAINGFEPGGTPRAEPIFEWVDPATLLVDEGYQRDLSERSLRLIRKIIAGWDWSRFKPPVAVMTDAGLELLDGQCTSIAACSHPDIALIPVMIVEAKQREERAAAFIGHNRDRIAVTPTQIHIAALVGGDEDALAVDRVCRAAGVTILRVPSKSGYSVGETLSVTAITALIRGRGEAGAELVLKTLVCADVAPLTQLHIKAADLLLHTDEYREIDAAKLADVIKATALTIDADAKVFVATHPSTPLWKAMAICWFKNRRGAKALSKSDSLITGNSTERKTAPSGGGLKSQPSVLERSVISDQHGRGKTNTKIDQTEPVAPTAEEDRPRALLPPERRGESVADGAKRDSRPELGRWQPGNHLRRCGPCGSPFVGGRKAEHCADCAYRAAEVARAS